MKNKVETKIDPYLVIKSGCWGLLWYALFALIGWISPEKDEVLYSVLFCVSLWIGIGFLFGDYRVPVQKKDHHSDQS